MTTDNNFRVKNNLTLGGGTISTDAGLNLAGPYVGVVSTSTSDIDLYTNNFAANGVEVWLRHNNRVEINTANGTYSWLFKNDGNATMPGNLEVANKVNASQTQVNTATITDLQIGYTDSLALDYQYQSGGFSVPYAGKITFNNGNQGAATSMYISSQDINNVDRTSAITSLSVGQTFAYIDASNSANYTIFSITSGPVHETQEGYPDYYLIGISMTEYGGSGYLGYSNNHPVKFSFTNQVLGNIKFSDNTVQTSAFQGDQPLFTTSSVTFNKLTFIKDSTTAMTIELNDSNLSNPLVVDNAYSEVINPHTGSPLWFNMKTSGGQSNPIVMDRNGNINLGNRSQFGRAGGGPTSSSYGDTTVTAGFANDDTPGLLGLNDGAFDTLITLIAFDGAYIATDSNNNYYNWKFDNAGVLTTPGEIVIANDNAHGGAGYAGMLTFTNQHSGATNINKYVRMNITGDLQIIDSNYSNTLFTVQDDGQIISLSTATISELKIGLNNGERAPANIPSNAHNVLFKSQAGGSMIFGVTNGSNVAKNLSVARTGALVFNDGQVILPTGGTDLIIQPADTGMVALFTDHDDGSVEYLQSQLDVDLNDGTVMLTARYDYATDTYREFKFHLGFDGVLSLPAVDTSQVSHNFDATNSTYTVATNDTIVFSSFSGEILINDLYDGYIYKFLCGGGSVWLLGSTNFNWDSPANNTSPSDSWTLADYASFAYTGGNYVFTNLAAERTFTVFAIKTRNGA